MIYNLKYMYLLVFVLVLLALLYYFLYQRPRKALNRYAKQFQSRGYRVLTLPYNPFSVPLLELSKEEAKKYRASHLSFTIVFNKYDVIITNALTMPWIVITSPHLLKQFISKQTEFLYEKDKMFLAPLQRTLGYGLLLSSGQKWAKKRKILNKVFKFDYIKSLHNMIVQKAKEGLQLIEQGQESSELKSVSFQEYGFYITQKTILESFMGSKDSEKATIDGQRISEYHVHLTDEYVQSLLTDPLSLIFGQKFENLGLRAKDRYFTGKMKILNEWIRMYVKNRMNQQLEMIKQQGEDYAGKDIFSAILKENYLLQKSGEQELIYSEQELVDEFKTFIFTGTDTSASALKVMIFLVFKHKEVEEKLREEISTVLNNSSDFSFEDMKKCVYLQAVFKETLRLYGPVNFNIMRRSVKDHYLDGIAISKGTIFIQYPISFHYSERYYRNPSYFRPERWLNGECQQMDLFNFVPFNSGNRSCIGKNLAAMQVKIGLIMVLLRYRRVEIMDESVEFEFKSIFSMQNYKSLALL